MKNQKQVVALLSEMSGQANVLTIPRFYLSLLDGDTTTALLLNQIVYWSDRSNCTDGFFYKSYAEWERETSLSQYQVTRAVNKLKKLGVLETKLKKANGAPTVHYKLNFDLLTEAIVNKLDYQETQQRIIKKLNNPLSRNSTIHYQETQQSLTETTTETTTETSSCELASSPGELASSRNNNNGQKPSYTPPPIPQPIVEVNPKLAKYPILKKYKRANGDLLFAFWEATGIKPIERDYKRDMKTTNDMLAHGITPEIVVKAVRKLRQDRLVISGPQSIMKVAISIQAQEKSTHWDQEEYERNKAMLQEERRKMKAKKARLQLEKQNVDGE